MALAARGRRRYCLYVSGTQDQADDHVQTIGAQLESENFGALYPDCSQRMVGKFGSPRAWRRSRLRTASGFSVDAMGLDTAMRGIKLDETRPDVIVLDDLDRSVDSADTVKKKVSALTRELIPAGAHHVAILGVQNLVRSDGVFGQLADGSADWLADRTISGPIVALEGMTYEQRGGRTALTGGHPTWAGMDVQACQQRIDDYGLRAFLAECQHQESAEGKAFPEWRRDVHVCDPFPIPAEWPKFRAVDYGYGVPFCCLWGARSPWGQVVVYRELYGAGVVDVEQARRIGAASKLDRNIRRSVGDPSMWTAHHNGYLVTSPAAAYADTGVELEKAANERLVGKMRVHDLLYWDPDSAPMLQVFSTCGNLIRTLPKLPTDPHDPEDVDTTAEDHAYDALRYLAMVMDLEFNSAGLQRSRYGFRR